MERLRLVLVGVEGAVNLGMIARLAENFGVDELYLVSPVASIEEAREYAARAAHRLDSAVVVDSLAEALRGSSISICTSSLASDTDILRTPVYPWEAARLAAAYPGTVSLVMGRESVGLTRDEISMCSLLSTIPASPSYQALNLSNATAIYLYEIYRARLGAPRREGADPRLAALIEAYARALAGAVITDERRARDVATALRRVASRLGLHRREAEHLLYLLSRACRRIEGCRVEVPGDLQPGD